MNSSSRTSGAGALAPLPDPPTVSVIVCTYHDDRWPTLMAAIDAVREQEPPPLEVIVVVDHNPRLMERVSAQWPSVSVVANDGEKGDSSARNAGIAHALGDIVLLLDDDAEPESAWLAEFARAHLNRDVLGVGGFIGPRWDAERPRWFPDEFLWVVGCSYSGLPDGGRRIRNPIGASMSIRRDVLVAIGGFRDDIARVGERTVNCEETEIAIRATRAHPGTYFVYEPRARVQHHIPRKRTSVRYFARACFGEGETKADLAALVGARAGLESEWRHVGNAVAGGIAREFAQALRHGDFDAASRATALVGGTALAAAGFATGRTRRSSVGRALRTLRGSSRVAEDGEQGGPETGSDGSAVVAYIELTKPISALRSDGKSNARVFVTVHGQMVGDLDVDFNGKACVSRAELQARITRDLAGAVAAHLNAESIPFSGDIDDLRRADRRTPGCLKRLDEADRDGPVISVVIPTRDRSVALRRCLSSLARVTYPSSRFEIVVVNNGRQRLEEADLRPATLQADLRVAHAGRSGSASARNVGLKVARGEIVAFTDDDVIIDPRWLSAFGAAFSDPVVDCVTGLVVPAELETPAQSLFERYGGFGKGYIRRRYNMRGDRPVDDPLFPFAMGSFGSGNNMAFRARVLRDLGGFDCRLGNGTPTRGGVDIEALFRVIVTGGTLVYEPAAVVRHYHRRSYADFRRQVFSYGSGLTAAMSRSFVEDPRLAVPLVARVPRAVWYVVSPRSPKNRSKGQQYPIDLRFAEVAGMAAGPALFARSAWVYRRESTDFRSQGPSPK